MENKTAVKWLVNQLTAIGQLEIPQGSNAVTLIIEQAKEMEKEQIIDAHIKGDHTYTIGGAYYDAAEQYYNEKYCMEKGNK